MCHFYVPAMVLDFLIKSSWNPVLVHDTEHIACFYLIRQSLNISFAPCQLFNFPVLIIFIFFFWANSSVHSMVCLSAFVGSRTKTSLSEKVGVRLVAFLLPYHFRVSDCGGHRTRKGTGL